MNMWEAIVIIVVVASFAKVLRARIRADALEARPPSDDTELRRELAALTERVKVLERITTDAHRGDTLAAEIEALRTPFESRVP